MCSFACSKVVLYSFWKYRCNKERTNSISVSYLFVLFLDTFVWHPEAACHNQMPCLYPCVFVPDLPCLKYAYNLELKIFHFDLQPI